MKITTKALSWFIKDLTNDVELISKSLTKLGYEVEDVYKANAIKDVVVARTTHCEKHPNADTLSLCKVITETNGEETEVICGGKNIKSGQMVAWAKPGSMVGEIKLAPKELRGIVSNGMILSISEIGGFDKNLVEDKNSKDIMVFNKEINFSDNVAELTSLDGYVIEVSILPDRQYASNIATLARELAVYNNWEIKNDYEDQIHYEKETKVDIELGEKAVGLAVSTIKFNENIETPLELRNILYHNGLKANGDATDLIRAVGLIWGNASYIVEGDIIKLSNNKLNDINTLTDSIKVKNGNLVAIASKFKTNPMSIKNMEKSTGLRNARGTTEKYLLETIETIIKLGKKSGMIVSATKPIIKTESQKKSIGVKDEELFHFIGEKINLEDSKKKLTELDFEFNKELVNVPSYRRDVEGKQDIVEEVLRFVGIDNITPDPISKDKPAHISFHKAKQVEVTELLTSIGISEARTYQLLSEKEVESYPVWNIKQRTQIRKDFGVKYNTVQTSLFKGLLEVYKHNYRQEKKDGLHFFEVQNVFHNDEDPHLHLGVIIDDEYQVTNKINQTIKLKTIAEKVIKVDIEFEDIDNKVFNNMNSAMISVKGEIIGMIGEIHPRILRDEKFIRLDKIKTKLFYLEIDLEKLQK